MAKQNKEKIKAGDLVIVSKNQLDVLKDNPIDEIDPVLYERIEELTCWFVLRAPLSGITRLANPGCIDMLRSDREPAKGARSKNRTEFEDGFLNPLDLDCTKFDFSYTRLAVKASLDACDLLTNDNSVFGSLIERCACFVGKDGSKEESCIESICRHIRNAFAHGRIAVSVVDGEPYIFAEDGNVPRDVDYGEDKPEGERLEVRFRMLLKISTLERWCDILRPRQDVDNNVLLE